MARTSFAFPEGHPRRRVSDIVIEHLEWQNRATGRIGAGLAVFFFLTTMASIVVATRYPWVFKIVAACS